MPSIMRSILHCVTTSFSITAIIIHVITGRIILLLVYYLPVDLHTCLAASHDVVHFTKGCPAKCNPPPDLRKQITILCLHLSYM